MKFKLIVLSICIAIIFTLSSIAHALAVNPPVPTEVPTGTYDRWVMVNGQLCFEACTALKYTDPTCPNQSLMCDSTLCLSRIPKFQECNSY